jgi:hypothetical protein
MIDLGGDAEESSHACMASGQVKENVDKSIVFASDAPARRDGELVPRPATFALFHRNRCDAGPKPDPSVCRGTQGRQRA